MYEQPRNIHQWHKFLRRMRKINDNHREGMPVVNTDETWRMLMMDVSRRGWSMMSLVELREVNISQLVMVIDLSYCMQEVRMGGLKEMT